MSRALLLSLFLGLLPGYLHAADTLAVTTEPPAIAQLRDDRSQSAETLLARVDTWGKSAPDEISQAWAKLAMGEFCDELERPAEAYELLNAAAVVAMREGVDDLAIAAHSRLASMYANRGEAERAATILLEMELLANRAQRADWQALWAYNRGVLERKLGHFDVAISYFEKSANLAQQGADPSQKARALNALGLVLSRTGKFADALARHNAALELARLVDDSAEIARTYRMLGFLHRNLDDEEQAAENIRQALQHLGPRDVREGIALRGELSRSMLKMGKVDEAAKLGEEAANAAITLGSPPNKVNSFTALSDVRLAQGRIDDATIWSERAADQFDSVAIRDQVQIQANRARIARARGDFVTALTEARATVAGTRKLGDKVLERSALDELSEVELASGDAMSAMATRKAFQALDKALAIDVAGRRVAILEANLATERAESARALLARDNQIQTLSLARQRLLGIALIAGLIALSVFAVLLLRRYRETRRLHAALIASAAELERVAMTDALTGVANRGAITTRLERLIDASHERHLPFAMLLIDIDHFKRVNDQFGHQAGDAVLRESTARMRSALPDTAQFGRWGGEEFIALLPDTTPEQARVIAENVREAVSAKPFEFADHQIIVSISIGLAAAPRPERRGIDRLVASADAALYRAKNAGRNRVEG